MQPNSTKIKSAKTFLKAFLRKFIPSKYTRYTVAVLNSTCSSVIIKLTVGVGVVARAYVLAVG